MDNFNFDNRNLENKNISPDFAEYEQLNNDVEIDFSEPENSISPSLGNNNVNNIINTANSYNNGINQNIRPNFQPNYYSYQHSYQPRYNTNYNPVYNQNPIITKHIQLDFEKKAVKRTSNHIGVGLILFYAFQILFSIFLSFFLINKGSAEFLNDSVVNLELNIIITLLGFGLTAFFILKTENTKVYKLVSFSPPKKGTFWVSNVIGIGFCFVANIAVSLLQSRFQNILPFAQNDIELPNGILGFILSVLAVAVAPALLEEFLFRGAIMGNLLKFGKSFAVFTSALLFALVHGNLVQIPFAFLVGLILGVMVIETDSIWTSVSIHFANNFISVLFDYLGRWVNEDILNVIYLFMLAIFMIFGILCFYLLSIKNKKILNYNKTGHISTNHQRFGWFSSSASIIIYYVIIFLEILMTQMTANMI